jgi:hypothetical protein
MAVPAIASTQLAPWKVRLFRILTICLASAFALAVIEWGLRSRQAGIARSDELESGMIGYDAELGWRLQAHWKGSHRHHDFAVQYAIDERGFRAPGSDAPPTGAHPLTAIVGDSFTFGLGVNDDQTFVHLLNRGAPAGTAFTNCAVPGYSTDQQALLIEKQVLPLKPQRILLIVYLANDLLDNPRATPLQVRSPKPFFELSTGGLVLRNTPVPLRPAPPTGPDGLTVAVLGPDVARWPWRTRLEQSSEVLRLVSTISGPAAPMHETFAPRFAPAVQLFGAILDRIHRSCAAAKVELVIATLAGKSYVEQPGSVSGQYQEYFREAVVRTAKDKGLPVLDVAAWLRVPQPGHPGPWFFPHDGHLTPAGHRLVADLLGKALLPSGGR